MKITKLQCPSCGGQLTINENNPMVAVCKYCDTHIALEWENQQPYFTKDTSQNRSSYQTPEDLLSDLKKNQTALNQNGYLAHLLLYSYVRL